MAPINLEEENHQRDAEFNQAMHGASAQEPSQFMAMLKKDAKAHQLSSDEYWKHWEHREAHTETEHDREARRTQYASLTKHYYNLTTDFYEHGWAQSFHFCRYNPGEGFMQALARHEHYLAHMMGLRSGMKVLDVGCGVGAPAREIARFTDVHITGLNNSDYQIDRAKRYTTNAACADRIVFVKGDFMQMSFPQSSFDAVYAIEATVHAPDLQAVYSQIFRVVKPGGVFGVFEWVMTDRYDDDIPHHRQIRLDIEQGNGVSNMVKASEAIRAIQAAGFQLEHHEDLADRPDAAPWYWPLTGDFRYLGSIWDSFRILRLTRIGRGAVHRLVGAMETLRLAPGGAQKTADALAITADALVAGGREKLFTPMLLMIARKPLVEHAAF